jgi:hypothetical protein
MSDGGYIGLRRGGAVPATHPQRFRVIGYCDVPGKFAGTDECTHFTPEQCFEAAHIPRPEAMRAAAVERGYKPVAGGPCDPIYFIVGDGLDYTRCQTCRPDSELIDNRNAPKG